MWCVCNHSGHRLRTWIPILILIQCGLICLYIAIIQDKSRTQSSSYSDKLSQATTKAKVLRQQGVYDNPLHVRVAFGNTQYDNEGGNDISKGPDGASRGSDRDLEAKRLGFRGRGGHQSQSDALSKTRRNYLTLLNNTLKNNSQAEIALQVGNVVQFQSGFATENKVFVEKKPSGMNNGGQLSVGIQALESISVASSRPGVQAEAAPHLMTHHSPAASPTQHYIQFNEAAVTQNYNAPNKKDVFTSHQAHGNNLAKEKAANIDGSLGAPDSNKDAQSSAAIKGQTLLHLTKTVIGQTGKSGEIGGRWRQTNHAAENHQVVPGPYAQALPHFTTKSPSTTQQTNHGPIVLPSKNGLPKEYELKVSGGNRTVIDPHPSPSQSMAPAPTKQQVGHKGTLNNGTVWPSQQAEYSTIKTLYGIHTQNRKYRSPMNDSSHGTNLFHAYNPLVPPVFHLLEDNATYFSHHGRNLQCMNEGTENVFLQGKQEACICKPAWHGEHCSVPDTAMYTSALRYINTLQLASKPRRLINAINFNLEWELLEARLEELYDLVDVFLLVESNYTMYGDPKPLRLLDRMRKGYLKAFHHKIAYLFVHTFPVGGRENGWIADQFARMPIGKEGLEQIEGIRPDDVFIYTDADEIPSRDVLLFLKLHNGYPEPFGLALRWSVFGFFWKQYDLTRIMVGCSVNMLRNVFQRDVYKLRTGTFQMQLEETEGVKEFTKNGGVMFEWYFGDGGAHAGWHCSWCMSPDRIRIKLTSAINADFPRWGDYPEKRDLTYIRNLIKTGTWFDDKTTFNSLVDQDSDPNLAPGYLLANYDQYRHLLDLKYAG